jgi:aspartyl-tRNA(Asn)/glutamyl-tRNA(Gln) amidotransferase subunit C
MSIDKETVQRIARLARLAMDEEHLAPMVDELNAILSWVEQLGELDVDNVEPLTGVVAHGLKMREDVVNDGGYPEDLTKNAPFADDNFFVVPKVLE